MGDNRKKIILIVLIFVFAGSLAYRITHPYRQKRIGTIVNADGSRQTTSVKVSPQGMEKFSSNRYVKLDLLDKPFIYSENVLKNIFFQGSKVTDIDKPIDQQTDIVADKEEKPISIEATNRLQVEQELTHFKSFGYLEDDNEITLFLEKGKRILVIRKGDRINGRYIVKNITKNELTLTAIDINEDVHIDISQL